MPVTFKAANPVYLQKGGFPNAETVLESGCEVQAARCKDMLQSFVEKDDLCTLYSGRAEDNGLGRALRELRGTTETASLPLSRATGGPSSSRRKANVPTT